MIREVSKSRKCPVCGKPDWCCFMDKDSSAGEEILICKRDTSECNVEGVDGCKYIYIGKSKNGNSVFEEYSQYKASHKGKDDYHFEKPKAQKQLTPVDIIPPKMNPDLDIIYKEMLNKLLLDDYHRHYLNSKGWDDRLIDYYNISTLSEPDHLRIRYKNRYKSKNPYRKNLAEKLEISHGKNCLLGVPGAYVDHGAWTFYGRSGILFPMFDMEGNVKRLRIRMDYRDQDCPVFKDNEGYYYIKDSVRYYLSMSGIYSLQNGQRVYIKVKGKYRTLASFLQDEEAEKEGFFANLLTSGCQSGNEYSLYTKSGDDWSIVFITEGEPKGMYSNAKMKFPFLTASGVTSYLQLVNDEILTGCQRRGTAMYIVASDADKKENDKVMDAEIALIKALKSKGMKVGVAEWDERQGKGIDDCLAAGHWPIIRMA